MTKTQAARVTFEATALESLLVCENFLVDALGHELEQAQSLGNRLLETTIARLSESAGTYAVCRLALELGVSQYRELLIDRYRIVYRYWLEENQASVYLFLHQRQDLKELLFHYQILS